MIFDTFEEALNRIQQPGALSIFEKKDGIVAEDHNHIADGGDWVIYTVLKSDGTESIWCLFRQGSKWLTLCPTDEHFDCFRTVLKIYPEIKRKNRRQRKKYRKAISAEGKQEGVRVSS